jgi:ABC-type Fe3+-hydroxamate transport system substrate-binding protein
LQDDKFRFFRTIRVPYSRSSNIFSELATALDVAKAGIELASKFSAQCKDWVANFYPRMRGKKVSFLTGTAPLILGGLWIPDMIVQTGAVSQYAKVGQNHRKVEWNEIVAFAPDVIIIAPGGLSVVSSMKRLAYFEALEGWEDLPAVKRGEVIFTDGAYHFSRPGPGLLESMGVLVSAISGLESGYITPRDSFHRLRWVEMNRGKLP